MALTRCSVPGCRRKPHARGLCQKHYDEHRKTCRPARRESRASAPDIEHEPEVAAGSALPVTAISQPPESAARDKVCCVAGCPNAHHAKGYCKMHYGQLRRHGRIEAVAVLEGSGAPPVLTMEQRLIEIKKRHEILKREIASINEALSSESAEVDEPEPEEE